jgi:hypothetical protein
MTDPDSRSRTDSHARSDDAREPTGTDAVRCPYCGRPLRDAGLRALHVGEVHDDRWTAGEREAYERARDAETDALFRYHVKVVAALVVLVFGLTYTYVFVLA